MFKRMNESGMVQILPPEQLSDDESEGCTDKHERAEFDAQLAEQTKRRLEQEVKLLQYLLKKKEGTGDGQFEELCEFPIFWNEKVSRRLHGTRIDTESAAARLIRSKSTDKRYVV